jgi:hypothetical protein
VCRHPACRAAILLAWIRPAYGWALAAALACTYSIWVVGGPHTSALEQESHAGDVLALAVAEGVHELAQLGCALDLEEDLIVVVGDLDVQVLRGTGVLWLLSWRAVVRHVVCAVAVVCCFGGGDAVGGALAAARG